MTSRSARTKGASQGSGLHGVLAPPTPGAEKTLTAALSLFRSQGYGGTSVREIATTADVTVAALYHHFASKQDILATLMTRAMHSILGQVSSAHALAGPDPVHRVRGIVDAHVRFHCTHQVEAFVGNSELRSLEGENLRKVVAL
ncbi:TetR family transcriptional regulator, partial [Streptomyces sp. SID5914]|nr:TetR family transcriptional regulator [Streptomyces sp. SID5914]